MADLKNVEFVTVFNRELGIEQRIKKTLWENPKNKAAYQHCSIVATKKVTPTEAPQKAEATEEVKAEAAKKVVKK